MNELNEEVKARRPKEELMEVGDEGREGWKARGNVFKSSGQRR